MAKGVAPRWCVSIPAAGFTKNEPFGALVVQAPNTAQIGGLGKSQEPLEIQGLSVERETGVGRDVPGEPERTGANCGSENSHLRLLSGSEDASKSTEAKQPRNSVTRQPAGNDAGDLILERLATLREHWQLTQDRKAIRRGLLDLLQALEEP
jgi:hypothetical protein